METVLVTAKAKWNLQELIPVVLTGGLGLLGLFLGTTGTFTTSGSIITMSVGFGLTLLILNISFGRKRKSTLFAKLGNNEDLSIEVWMRKPIKDKWQGKMDEGKNIGSLANIRKIKMDNIRGTRVVVFFMNGEQKPFYLPTRLLNTDAVRKYIAKALAQLGGKVKFESKEDAIEFKALLTGVEYFRPEEVKDYAKVGGTGRQDATKKVVPKSSNKATVKPAVFPPVENAIETEELVAESPQEASAATVTQLEGSDKEAAVVADEVVSEQVTDISNLETEVIQVIPKPKKKMGYGAYNKPKEPEQLDPILAVANATDKITEEPEEKEEDKHHSLNNGDALIGNLFGGGSSVSINLDSTNPEAKDK
jgi:hypothetical protein